MCACVYNRKKCMYSLGGDVLLCFPGVDRTDFLEPEKKQNECQIQNMRTMDYANNI